MYVCIYVCIYVCMFVDDAKCVPSLFFSSCLQKGVQKVLLPVEFWPESFAIIDRILSSSSFFISGIYFNRTPRKCANKNGKICLEKLQNI